MNLKKEKPRVRVWWHPNGTEVQALFREGCFYVRFPKGPKGYFDEICRNLSTDVYGVNEFLAKKFGIELPEKKDDLL